MKNNIPYAAGWLALETELWCNRGVAAIDGDAHSHGSSGAHMRAHGGDDLTSCGW